MEISVMIVCWNNLNDLKLLIKSLKSEIIHLEKAGIKSNVSIYDNASTDGTKEFFEKEAPEDWLIHYSKINYGIGVSRNYLIDQSITGQSKYFFMFDGDVAILPESMLEMIRFMEENPELGGLAQHITNSTKDPNDPRISIPFPKLQKSDLIFNIKSGIGAVRGYTHYVVYNRWVFDKNARFEVGDAFGHAGYGFEDDDIGMQIHVNLKADIAAFDICCYHTINSSVPALRKENGLFFEERRRYFLKKWQGKLFI